MLEKLKSAARRWLGEPQASTISWGGISWDDWVRGNVSGGVGVSEATARTVAAVTACVNIVSGSIASMPLHLYRRDAKTGERTAYKDDLWWLLNERPYTNWSSYAFWTYLVSARMFHGDAIAIIRRANRFTGEPAGFEPWHPGRVNREKVAGRVRYTFHGDGPTFTLDQDDVLHVPGPGFDGLYSLSQLQYGLRHAAGIAQSADEQAASIMKEGARPDFAIETPGNPNQQQRDDMRSAFVARHRGNPDGRPPIIMAGGAKLHQLTMSSQDAELLATRAFQIEEVCRIFGVPPFMIGHTEKTTSWGSGVEQMGIGFVKYTLQPHLVAIEQELNHKLFKTSRNFAEFVTAGLERGDIKTRFESYRIALGRAGEQPWMDADEVRRLENLPPNANLKPNEGAANGQPPSQTAG
jgi:HK97 family phage portal protein